jgi:uncharacterized protein (TIGR02246 family)
MSSMSQSDDQAIRDLIATWMRATAAGDIERIRPLMAEDVVFLTPGNPPMRGRDAFAAGFEKALLQMRIEPSSEIQEIQVFGDWAYVWNRLTVMMTPLKGGPPVRRAGDVLTVLSKNPAGKWELSRDGNMLAPDKTA